jgi:Ca2+/Na+ antiporter
VPVLVGAPLFLLAACVSLATSWLLVSRLERVGERLGLSEALLGMVAALAADAPEITSAVTALLTHQQRVGAGVVIGSNVFNLAALLGLGALVAGGLRFRRRVVVLGGSVAMFVAIVCLVTVLGWIPAWMGLGLAAIAMLDYMALLGVNRPFALGSLASRRGGRGGEGPGRGHPPSQGSPRRRGDGAARADRGRGRQRDHGAHCL